MKVAVTTLAFCVAALLALGLVMLYSSSMTQVGAHYLMLQLIWCAFGFVLCVTATTLDYQWLKKFAWPIFILALVLLVLVLLPCRTASARKINGAHRWFILPGMRLQPSEFAKLALVIMLAWYGDRYQRQMQTWKRGIVFSGMLIALVLGLIFVEPDRGTTILLAAVSGAMLLVAGVRWKHILIPAVCSARPALAVSILHDPMRMKRIFSWWDLEQHKDGVGYQAYQAMIALGSGGWTGLGLGNGRQKLGFVPEDHTDFIFSIIGEELGLIATLLVVARVRRHRDLRHLHRAQRPRHLRLPARAGHHVVDRSAGRHQHRRRHQRAAEQGPAAAVHQLRRLEPAGHARRASAFCSASPATRPRARKCSGRRPSVTDEQSLRREEPPHDSTRSQHALRRHRLRRHGRASLSGTRRRRSNCKQRGCAVALLISPKDVDQQAVKSARGMEIFTLPAVGAAKSELFFLRRQLCEIAVRRAENFPPPPTRRRAGDGRIHQRAAGLGRKRFRRQNLSARIQHHSRPRQPLARAVCGRGVRRISRSRRAVERAQSHADRHAGAPAIFADDPASPTPQCRAALRTRSEPSDHSGHGRQPGRERHQRNDSVRPAVARRPAIRTWQWLHLTGANDFEKVKAAYAARGLKAVVKPFLAEMDLALGAATAAVSRAGASSLAEIAAMRLPSLLVPFPAAADNHQFYNARAFEATGAARLLEQKNATPEKVAAIAGAN